MNQAMFSTMPARGMFTCGLRNISTPRRTSATAICWGGGNDHAVSIFNFRNDREVNISRAGRKIHEQEIERSPACLVDHLPQGVHRHCTAPQQGVRRFHEEADRHDFHIHRFGRQDDILPVHLFGFGQVTFQTEHLGLRRAVDVGVEDADPETPVAQGDGKVGRDGRFSDTALARSDRYDVAMSPVMVGLSAACGFLGAASLIITVMDPFRAGKFSSSSA